MPLTPKRVEALGSVAIPPELLKKFDWLRVVGS